ncbi:endonuclease domain-containing protein [Caulobacter segnis]
MLDFYCAALRLALEVDGYDHCVGSRPQRDLARDQWLAAISVRTLRIPAREVMTSMDDTLSTIREHIAHLPPPDATHPPPPEGKKGRLVLPPLWGRTTCAAGQVGALRQLNRS